MSKQDIEEELTRLQVEMTKNGLSEQEKESISMRIKAKEDEYLKTPNSMELPKQGEVIDSASSMITIKTSESTPKKRHYSAKDIDKRVKNLKNGIISVVKMFDKIPYFEGSSEVIDKECLDDICEDIIEDNEINEAIKSVITSPWGRLGLSIGLPMVTNASMNYSKKTTSSKE